MDAKEYQSTRWEAGPELHDIAIPARVFIERGEMTVRQALARYLVDHPRGPQLKLREAAAIVGTTTNSFSTSLTRARKRAGEDPRSEGPSETVPWSEA